MSPPADTPLIPDPERIRARLAELAREQSTLRKVLRAVERERPSASPGAALSLNRGEDGGECGR